MQKEVDCLIIGAGPTGLTLGIGLLLQKKSVLIVEKHVSQLGFSKAILVNSDTLAALSDLGVTKSLKENGIILNGFSLYANDTLNSCAPFDTSVTNAFHPISIPQEVTEKCLLERFQELGGELQLGMSFEADANHPESWEQKSAMDITLKSKQYSLFSVRCHWLFGCDGVHSSVRRAMQIDYRGYSQNEERYILDAIIESWALPTHVSVWFGLTDALFVILISEHPLTVRIVGTTRESCQKILDRFAVKEITWDGAFTNSFRVAASYGRGHVWLAGDAAHVHSPIGGRGMNMGILEGVELAKAVSRGDDARSYEAKCRPVARRWVIFNFVIAQVVMSQMLVFRALRALLSVVFVALGYVLGPVFAKMMFESLTTARVKLHPSVAQHTVRLW